MRMPLSSIQELNWVLFPFFRWGSIHGALPDSHGAASGFNDPLFLLCKRA